ncbi:MAG: pntAA [Deltaproteobacteria bacterium]|nr:pntAA [Deltaproteobacteria bacterium]
MKIGVPREIVPGERRVALTPDAAAALAKLGLTVLVEAGAGSGAFFSDAAYEKAGASIVPDAAALYGQADVVLKVQKPQEHSTLGQHEVDLMREGTVLVAFFAGTVFAAKVLVMGAGVAGLQAIATTRRLGAQVWGYDVRPVVKEQVESLGAKFLEFNLGVTDAEDKGGYAKALSADASRKQQELLAEKSKEFDVIITTALVPGRAAPRLITKENVAAMRPGSVIVDLAAEAGGNCELTEPDRVITVNGVTIHGPTNLPATVPVHASQLYARNVTELLKEFVKDGALALDFTDEVINATCVTHGGEIVNEAVKAAMAGERTA